ncbi:MAG: hypothetical protein JRH20_20835, partial [Deltaproteobacteria bacterium]|nr:hypothetical protein [Deltaproteobacteria bacterium]
MSTTAEASDGAADTAFVDGSQFDLAAPECLDDEDCTDPLHSSCLAGRCVEPAGEVQCREDAHCAAFPGTPRCWMGVCIGEPVARKLPEALGVNTWMKVSETTTGGRLGPVFAFVPPLGRFVVSGGVPGAPAADKLHFSTEHLDLESKRYENVYPPQAPAIFTPAEGPTQAPPHPPWGYPSFDILDKEDIARMPFFRDAFDVASNAYFQWTYVPDRGLVYAFIHNKTLTYNPQTQTWVDLEVMHTPTDHHTSLIIGTRAMMWGAMGYDPIHQELVLTGGSSSMAGGSPGTWVFSLKNQIWRRLTFGSIPLNALRGRYFHPATSTYADSSPLRRYHPGVHSSGLSQFDDLLSFCDAVHQHHC